MSLRFSKLDRPSIRKLKPGDKVMEHGIMAERLADGDIRYSVNIMVDGTRIHRVIGRGSEGVTRTQAEEFISSARSQAREGRLSLPQGRKTCLGFSDAAEQYIYRLEETGGKNMVEKRRHLRSHLKPFFGSQRLDTISTFTVDRYKRRRVEEGAANGTVNLELGTLSHFLRRAVEWRWVKALPCKLNHLDRPAGRIIALTEEQCDALSRASAADSDPYCWLFVAFGLNTAMRHREILKARFEHLDLDRNRLFVPRAKSGMREQPITPQLAQILRKEREMASDPDGWIFPSPRPHGSLTGHRDRMSKPFRRAVIAAGLDPKLITPHVMRHTAITALVKAGIDLPTIQRISGHKTLAMVLRYTHVHSTHIDQAIRAIGRAVPEPSENRLRDIATPALHTQAADVTPWNPAIRRKQ